MKKQNRLGSRLLIGLMFLFLYAPILLLIVFSFNAGDSSAVWKGFSLHWYGKLFQNRLIMESVYTTLLVSLLATAIATAAGTFAAIGLYSLGRKKREALLTVNNIPMMNADIVTGVSLCLFFVAFFQGWGTFARWFNDLQSVVELPERLVLGFGTLLLAHVSFNIPYVILNVAPKLRQMDRNLMDAAQDLGCTWMQAFWKVMLPEIKPGIVSGALIAFTMSIDDFIISYFTAGSASSTLAMTIYGMTKKRVTPEINAVSTLLFLSVLVLLVLSNLKEVRAEARSRKGAAHRSTALEKLGQRIAEPRFRWVRRGTAAALACAFLFTVVVLAKETGSRPVVNVCSWGEYIDEDLITQFEDTTGIRVNYQTAESNETLYSLLKSGGADYDVVVPSDYMIGRLIQEDMLDKLDYSQIPNFSLIDDRFKHLSYDPANEYTVPYAWGTLGIIYNTAMVEEEITSWSALYDDRYAGNVLLINNSRDALGEALLYLGYSVNTTDEGEIRQAYELVADANRRGVFQGRVMDEVLQKMEGGNAAIATYYAGDYISMLENNEDLAFVIPEEGSNWFVDAMCMLKDAPHQKEAHMWMNFIASTESNLMNMDYIGYASPNREALERYPAYYEELYGEELEPEIYDIMVTPPEILERCEAYLNLPAATLNLYNTLWTQMGVN
ncbi:extracellular solute-binding protein [Pseudoflavonifractor sp. 60]|uniref:extracellular solute-binding protein n=1 Tax=Pseudoflavonifractor sp. 60 TaxID=2304576 RepID=UPI00136D064D|nr:extracellular solute-binding protein [Pseudoflavonifractor sp. 60]NBI66942.1 extracellular solute-binding protein [Pseudoflavonifractor sp. 60]